MSSKLKNNLELAASMLVGLYFAEHIHWNAIISNGFKKKNVHDMARLIITAIFCLL